MDKAMTTRLLLAAGIAAGPTYVVVTLAQAVTRPGFDLRIHRYTYLTSGDLGWVQQLNMVLVGVLTMAFALGAYRLFAGRGRGARLAPLLLGLAGLAYLAGGVLRADPVVGFPAGTTAEMVRTTWQGALQNSTRGASTALLIAASVVIALRFAGSGDRRRAWLFGLLMPIWFAAVTGLGLVIGGNPTSLAFLTMPWIWLTVLAVTLSRTTGRVERTPGRILATPWST